MRRLAARADVDDIDGWFRRILKQLTALLAAAWRAIRELTRMHLEDHAAAEGRTVTPTLAEWNTEQVLTSLRVQGPVAFKQAISAGHDTDEARRSMGEQLAGSAVRLTLAADRETTMATIENSDEIVGYRRVPDADPCAWCAMLASRGAVYATERSAGEVVGRRGVARGSRQIGESYHDFCQCTIVALYEHEDEPPEVVELRNLWHDVTDDKPPGEKLNAWREFWDNRAAPPEDDRQQRARDRQATIDEARRRAEMLAELEEIAVINEASGDELARMAGVAADRFGVADDPELAALLRRAAEGDAAMVEATLEAVAARLELTRVGGELGGEQIIRFDRALHDMLPGDRPTPFVEVVRPGFTANVNGEQLVVVRAVVASSTRTPAAPAASTFHRTLNGIEDLAAIVADIDDNADRRRLSGGMSADVELVKLADGRVIVHKRGLDWGDPDEVAESVRSQADAEALTPLVARELEALVARVYRNEVDAVWMEFIDGDLDAADTLMDGDDAIRLGLLDILTANGDRNSGNRLGRAGRLLGIDHGFNWGRHFIEPDQLIKGREDEPAKHFADEFDLRDNPLTPHDVVVLRERLEALRPDFAHVGREDWLDYSLRVLERLRPFAKGARNLYG